MIFFALLWGCSYFGFLMGKDARVHRVDHVAGAAALLSAAVAGAAWLFAHVL